MYVMLFEMADGRIGMRQYEPVGNGLGQAMVDIEAYKENPHVQKIALHRTLWTRDERDQLRQTVVETILEWVRPV